MDRLYRLKQAFKTKIIKYKTSSLRTSLNLQIISTRTLELFINSLKQLFLYLHLWKKHISSSFYQWVVFCKFADRKAMRLMPKILCLLEIQARYLLFSLHKIKIRKQHRITLLAYPLTLYILHMGVILIISKVFSIIFLLCLWK